MGFPTLIPPHAVLEIFGEGQLWRQTTGINEETGITVQDRPLIAKLASYLRLTSPVPTPTDADAIVISRSAAHFPDGEIDVYGPFGQLSYEPSVEGEAEEMGLFEPENGLMVSMRPGHDRQFLSLVRRLAGKARAHRHGIALQELPSS